MDLSMLSTIFVSAIFIGVFAVVMGGTLFLSLPLFQILFPEMSLGAIVGNVKFGSIFRNATALIPLYKQLDKKVLWLAPTLCLGSIMGSWLVASVSQAVVPGVLITGLLIHEYGKKLKLPDYLFWVIAFLIGFYGGIFGAGIMLLIVLLLRLRDTTAIDARANALLLEMLLSFVAVLTFWHLNLINWPIAIVWAAGGMGGGLIGGLLIKHTGRWSQRSQDWLIRVAFLIALIVAVWKIM